MTPIDFSDPVPANAPAFDAVEHLVAELLALDPLIPGEFAHMVSRALTVLDFTEDELGRILRVSRPTICRWAEGTYAPHPFLRSVVREALIGLAKAGR